MAMSFWDGVGCFPSGSSWFFWVCMMADVARVLAPCGSVSYGTGRVKHGVCCDGGGLADL